jgi:hypothetical protein
VSIDWIDTANQDDEAGIISVQLSTPNGFVVLD